MFPAASNSMVSGSGFVADFDYYQEQATAAACRLKPRTGFIDFPEYLALDFIVFCLIIYT
jgi:hypothetical protein